MNNNSEKLDSTNNQPINTSKINNKTIATYISILGLVAGVLVIIVAIVCGKLYEQVNQEDVFLKIERWPQFLIAYGLLMIALGIGNIVTLHKKKSE
ncbi:hypothetical protein SHELI_v1c02980 [Spiroplasma helicoides]|uniref:DUF3098 domain-containing protein n=1 Tax=Spiroplasma helicoides TaxID=216938 RepID=A0A1B3SJZ0_9MOLU|nr:hypothetical protein [Spiroplasma helicoides]AOG60253.1 hypothetical protein SHELI_v1c02980 [Spiroplasma helicoides]